MRNQTSCKNKYSRKSYVRDIYLELPSYKYLHGPVEIDNNRKDERFLGRSDIKDQFLNVLRSDDKSGAYLVTGYRGMGKTSFVNKVIKEYDPKGKRTRVLDLCLNQNKIELKDVYKQIAVELRDKLQKGLITPILDFLSFIIFLVLVSFLYYLSYSKLFKEIHFTQEYLLEYIIIVVVTTSLLGFIYRTIYTAILERSYFRYRFFLEVNNIVERSSSEQIKEKGIQSAGNRFPLGFISKRTAKYPLASAKEVEQELIRLLKKYQGPKELLIIFDELDKVDPHTKTQFYYDELEVAEDKNDQTVDSFRERRKIIIEILGSLKHFITRANARFIFIAGREMFDASLADINDRQSSISSIFHQIINVESFLKDTSYNNSKGITNVIEEFLKEVLLPRKIYKKAIGHKYVHQPLFRTYYELLPDNLDELEKQKIIYALQQYLIYLVYRSNGAPHKLNKIIEDMIVNSPTQPSKSRHQKSDSWKYIIVTKNQLKTKGVNHSNTRDQDLFLKFSADNQYRFAFISYLYRPFILTYSHYLKEYSDRVLISTPFLMDYLIKFHPFAFSLEHLELLPEVISSNRQPIIRYFTEEIVAFLQQNLIRDTEIGLFDYKYFKKIQNELDYLSKIFEDESAAFNFTLDENYDVKLQLRVRIKELRSVYKNYLPSNGNKHVYSISHLNTLLGDVHFFDQEYSECIVTYQDALQSIRTLIKKDSTNSVELFIHYVRINLKLGLTYEKMRSYEIALGYYSNIVNSSKQFFNTYRTTNEAHTKHAQKSDSSKLVWKKFNTEAPSSISDLLQICVQGFLAKLYLQEKISIEGVTISKVLYTQIAFHGMVSIANNILKQKNKEIFSNFQTNVGTLLFFKNLNYSKSILNDFFPKRTVETIDFYRKELEQSIKAVYANKDNIIGFSPYAYVSYKTSLANLLQINEDDKSLEKLLRVCVNKILVPASDRQPIPNEAFQKIALNKTELKNTAIILSKIGDVLLSFLPINKSLASNNQAHPINNLFNSKIINDFSSLARPHQDWEEFDNYFLDFTSLGNLINVKLLIKIYYLASKIYIKAGINVSASFQLRKILHIIRISTKFDPLDEKSNKTIFKFIEYAFFKKILELISWNSNSTDRPQIDKFESYFGIDGISHPKQMTKNIYKHISNSHETKEALLFYAPIKINAWNFNKIITHQDKILQFNKIVFEDCAPFFEEQSLVYSQNSISSQFTRILELSFQERSNRIILNRYISAFLRKNNTNNLISDWDELFYKYKSTTDEVERAKMLKEYFNRYLLFPPSIKDRNKLNIQDIYCYFGQLVINSIYSLHQIIKIINICGVSYMMSYSYLAHFHRKLGNWLKYFTLLSALKKVNQIDFDVKPVLSNLIGKDSLRTLDSTSQFQLAIQNYRRAIQLHSQGRTYYRQIRNMIYLEDDYNDNLYHYCAAVERQQINSGRIEQYIKNLTNDVRKSQLLELDRYMNND